MIFQIKKRLNSFETATFLNYANQELDLKTPRVKMIAENIEISSS